MTTIFSCSVSIVSLLACSDMSHCALAVPAPTSTPESQSNDEWMSNRSLHTSISSPYFLASHVCQAHPSPAIIPQLCVHTTKNSPLLQKEIDAGGGGTKQQRHKLSNCEGRAWTQGSERFRLSVCGCLFERVCDTFTSSLLCHDYHHDCSLSEQRSSCVPLVRLNCTAFYIITTSTLSALPTHGALHAVQCVADSKDLLSRTRLDHKVVMPAIFIHCSAVRPIRLLTAHAGPLVTFASSVGCKHRSTVSEQNPHCGFIRCVGQLTTFFVHSYFKNNFSCVWTFCCCQTINVVLSFCASKPIGPV